MNLVNQSPKQKISIIVSDLSVSGAGRWGGATAPFLIAKALQSLGYQVEILGLAFDSNSRTLYDPEIPITAIPCQYYSGLLEASKELLSKIDGDIIYAVKLKTSSFGLGIIKKLLSNRPLIVNIDDWELSWYGGDEWQYKPKPKQLMRDLFSAKGELKNPDHPFYLQKLEGLIHFADAITVASSFLQNRFGGTYLPLCKDTNLFNPELYDSQATRHKYGLSDYRVLMFPGAPRPYKGLEDVLQALELINQPDLKLVIVGGSPYDDYDEILQKHWGRWIIKLDKQPVAMMPEVVSASDIIVVPQRDVPATSAQFPLKLTDGMAMAKPVLATYVGDIPQILADTGFLVAPDSPEQLAEKITWIFENLDAAKEQGKRARERCQQLYSLDNMAQRLEQVIGSL